MSICFIFLWLVANFSWQAFDNLSEFLLADTFLVIFLGLLVVLLLSSEKNKIIITLVIWLQKRVCVSAHTTTFSLVIQASSLFNYSINTFCNKLYASFLLHQLELLTFGKFILLYNFLLIILRKTSLIVTIVIFLLLIFLIFATTKVNFDEILIRLSHSTW